MRSLSATLAGDRNGARQKNAPLMSAVRSMGSVVIHQKRQIKLLGRDLANPNCDH